MSAHLCGCTEPATCACWCHTRPAGSSVPEAARAAGERPSGVEAYLAAAREVGWLPAGPRSSADERMRRWLRAWQADVAAEGLELYESAVAAAVAEERATTGRAVERMKMSHPMNGDGHNYALEKVTTLLIKAGGPGVAAAIADERAAIDREADEFRARLDAENDARRASRAALASPGERCSTCGEPLDSLGCTVGPDRTPAHTVGGGCQAVSPGEERIVGHVRSRDEAGHPVQIDWLHPEDVIYATPAAASPGEET